MLKAAHEAQAKVAAETMTVYLNNVLNNPTEPKYRKCACQFGVAWFGSWCCWATSLLMLPSFDVQDKSFPFLLFFTQGVRRSAAMGHFALLLAVLLYKRRVFFSGGVFQ